MLPTGLPAGYVARSLWGDADQRGEAQGEDR